MTQGWEKAKISHKFSTPSWKATILAKWSRPSAILRTTLHANTNTAWTKHNTLTVLPILQLKVFHYWGKTSWHCLFGFSAEIVIWCNLSLNTNTNIALTNITLSQCPLFSCYKFYTGVKHPDMACVTSLQMIVIWCTLSLQVPNIWLARRFRASSIPQTWETARKLKKKNCVQVNMVVEVIDGPAFSRQEKREKGDHVETWKMFYCSDTLPLHQTLFYYVYSELSPLSFL